MVLQRTIENLRERPKEERKSIALGISAAVMASLFIGWAMYFFRTVNLADAPDPGNAVKSAVANVKEAYDQSGWVSESTRLPTESPQTQEVPQDSSASMQLIQEGVESVSETL